MSSKKLPDTRSKTESERNEFCQSIISYLEEVFPEGTQIECLPLQKNNGIVYDSICIREPGANCAPAIRIEPYYTQFSNGAEFDVILKAVIEDYEKSKMNMTFDTTNLYNYEWIKERIGFKLVNFEKNEEMLKEMPHVSFLDLAVVAFVDMIDIVGVPSTFTVFNRHMKEWNVGTTQLIKDAMENMVRKRPATLHTMTEILNELSDGMCPDDEKLPMYVLTNASKNLGAGCVLYDGMLQTCAEKVGKEFYLLPSSIHELILIPCEASDPEELICMVRDINRAQVSSMERLSDRIYKYDKDANIISILNMEEHDMRYGEVTECGKFSFTTQIGELLFSKSTY